MLEVPLPEEPVLEVPLPDEPVELPLPEDPVLEVPLPEEPVLEVPLPDEPVELPLPEDPVLEVPLPEELEVPLPDEPVDDPLLVVPLPEVLLELPLPEVPPWAGTNGMVPSLQPIRKRMANNKTLILNIRFPRTNRDRDRRTSPFWPDGMQGPENVRFQIAELRRSLGVEDRVVTLSQTNRECAGSHLLMCKLNTTTAASEERKDLVEFELPR